MSVNVNSLSVSQHSEVNLLIVIYSLKEVLELVIGNKEVISNTFLKDLTHLFVITTFIEVWERVVHGDICCIPCLFAKEIQISEPK